MSTTTTITAVTFAADPSAVIVIRVMMANVGHIAAAFTVVTPTRAVAAATNIGQGYGFPHTCPHLFKISFLIYAILNTDPRK